MKYGSALGKARGLGSAKGGSRHWWAQRVTSVALIPLVFWFALAVARWPHADYGEFIRWVAAPWNTILLLSFIIAAFYHAILGLQVIIEDYVHSDLKLTLIMCNTFFCFVIGLSCLYALVKLSFGV